MIWLQLVLASYILRAQVRKRSRANSNGLLKRKTWFHPCHCTIRYCGYRQILPCVCASRTEVRKYVRGVRKYLCCEREEEEELKFTRR